jgi:hypothetical protein
MRLERIVQFVIQHCGGTKYAHHRLGAPPGKWLTLPECFEKSIRHHSYYMS